MPIEIKNINNIEKFFHLYNKNISYMFYINKYFVPINIHFGKRAELQNIPDSMKYYNRPYTPCYREEDSEFTLETACMEYSLFGITDFRPPTLSISFENGSNVFELAYKKYEILHSKVNLKGLPSTFSKNDGEATTLIITLEERDKRLAVDLIYTIFEKHNVITRSALIKNTGIESFIIEEAMSFSIDLKGFGYDIINLAGAWGRERHVDRTRLYTGERNIGSVTGASSHIQSPFMAVCLEETNEKYGEAYGFGLLYSGNHKFTAYVGTSFSTRIVAGINNKNFSWILDKEESFQTPEAVLVYSENGLGGMSRTFHNFFREHLCRSLFADKIRPVLINNWEATYFDFNRDEIIEIAEQASNLGVELFVLDDGWFADRNADNCSLGDWYVNLTKLPGGLSSLANEINKMGMQFGIWVEPEMVSPTSNLYKEHSDWCLHSGYCNYLSRNQLVLDLSREDVQNYIIDKMSEVFLSANISYVKWDMNRYMTNVGSAALATKRQREVSHRYILGLYRILDILTQKFPYILFEGCAGGGGRFDPGFMHYMAQFWTSDDTDAWERCLIQYGTSFIFPPIFMGNHVSIVPNHQTNRITPIKTRANIALMGAFGYELDLRKLTAYELEEIKIQIDVYKEIRKLLLDGNYYRIGNPSLDNLFAWQIVSKDKNEIIAVIVQKMMIPNGPKYSIRLEDLKEDALYKEMKRDKGYTGSQLMYVGFDDMEFKVDFDSMLLHFKCIGEDVYE